MLTRKQQQVLEFIRNYMAKNQQSPTEAEIAEGIGIKSRGVAHRYVVAIEQSGYIKTIPGKRRNIRLRHNYKNQVLGLPLMGCLAKDSPIKAPQQTDIINLDTKMLKPNRFLLQVTDNYLQKCGIFSGDFIVCERHNAATDGEMVIAIIKEKTAQLKTFHWNGDGTVGLSDPYFATNLEIFNANDVKVHAIYKALFRINETKDHK
jgi:repressor LexA